MAIISQVSNTVDTVTGYHYAQLSGTYTNIGSERLPWVDVTTYSFENFFHPLVGKLIAQLNQTSVSGMLDPSFLTGIADPDSTWFWNDYTQLAASESVKVVPYPRNIDVTLGGPYANYNWELLYHIPVMIAVHLSNNQRFNEAQKWFHLVFDPTSTDQTVPPPMRYWKCLPFRNNQSILDINSLLQLLSTPNSGLSSAQQAIKANVLTGYDAMLQDPFSPHAIARTRISAYQSYVVMKYLDNLIAWGDSLFMQDTIETINEATLCYVLAANILGPEPQQMPQQTASAAKNFLQLKQAGLDAMGNAFVNLESQFPFNMMSTSSSGDGTSDQTGALFGMARSLYFCVPPNANLLAYWDTVADRLFKIRNSENIAGQFQQLPLFDPPLDPGMLVKAAAAGIDIGSIVSGLNQPTSPVRSLMLIQKSLEIAAEVRALGAQLLAALEKGDGEQLSLLRQSHEIALQQLMQNSRFLQWKHAQETTNGLLTTRNGALERYTFYLRLLGATPDSTNVPPTLALNREELTEANFDDTYTALVGQYNLPVPLQTYPKLQLAQATSPSNQSGATGSGQLFLNTNEDSELNTLLPAARDYRLAGSVVNAAAPILNVIPDIHVDLHYWGLGAHTKVFGGDWMASAARAVAEGLQMVAAWNQDQASIASRTATYQRRADEWMLQANNAAHELMVIGEQILASLIAEQVAYHDYQTAITQVKQAQEVQSFLQNKFTSAVFYNWMQSDIAGIYYQYYRFACDTARKAEATMKLELMRPELDATEFIQFNYWDSGHQGLLSGEALHLDIKRMEMAYHDNNKRELELTRHISLRQLDPLPLISLRTTGSCSVSVPEWLFDRDCPGHYMRRIKSVAVSLPSVVGSFTSVNCTLSLQSSTLRVSPLLNGGVYARDTTQDDARFVDYFAGAESIVTSSATNDSGMFETNLRDDRFLPFEGQGVESNWTLELPQALRTFDYTTISDVLLHFRYTARQAGDPLGSQATTELVAMFDTAGQAGQALFFCLRYDFPTEWSAFVNGGAGAAFQVVLRKSYFPYPVQSAKELTVDSIVAYAANGNKVASVTEGGVDLGSLSTSLSKTGSATLSLPADSQVMTQILAQQVYLVLNYHFGVS
jgi:hypothetical protein